jgi:formiminoglutamate deiminase
MARYWCEQSWSGDPDEAVLRNVLVEVSNGRVVTLQAGIGGAPDDADVLRGLTMPGCANAHSHAFHRALRGRTHGGAGGGGAGGGGGASGGTFWTWRDQMYRVAAVLQPDLYYRLARAVYAEMAQAGVTAVGEFHYLHHDVGGARYSQPWAMAEALAQAAADAGIRITLLDVLYLAGGIDQPLSELQRRFSDGDHDGWRARTEASGARLATYRNARTGSAVHSVRAVPRDALAALERERPRGPLHAHVSEQPAENEQSLAAYGCTPTELLHRYGLVDDQFTAVHATHVTDHDVSLLASSYVCLCPTTERDLADGVGPASRLASAGTRLTLGSDSHAVIDLLEEARAVELNERLVTGRRGLHPPARLLGALLHDGHGSIGWDEHGWLRPGSPFDVITIRLDSERTVGGNDALASVLFSATASDVTDVIADGAHIVADGRHRTIDVAAELSAAIAALDDLADGSS